MKKQNETKKPTFNLATIKGILAAFSMAAGILSGKAYSGKVGRRSDAWSHKRVSAKAARRATAALRSMVVDVDGVPMVAGSKPDTWVFPGSRMVVGGSTTKNPASLGGMSGVVASVGAGKAEGCPGTQKHLAASIGHLCRVFGDAELPSGALVAHCRQSLARFVVVLPSDEKPLLGFIAKAATKLSDDSDKDTRAGLIALGVQIAADCHAFSEAVDSDNGAEYFG